MPRDISQYHYRPENCYVVTLDLQLYIKTMQLYSECDIGGDHFVSIYGELHVVFAISRAIGKYMKNSGLNKRLSLQSTGRRKDY